MIGVGGECRERNTEKKAVNSRFVIVTVPYL